MSAQFQGPQGAAQYAYRAWWKTNARTLHNEVFSAAQSCRKLLRTSRMLDQNHLRIYANYDVAGTGESRIDQRLMWLEAEQRMRYQLCTCIVDTAQSIICANKPVPYYVTEGGEFSAQRRARNRTKIIQGQMHDIGLYDIAPTVARDGMILGSGWVYGYVDANGKPAIERVLPGEVFYDPSEAISGKPRSIYRVQLIARETLLALFPDAEKLIRNANGPSVDDWKDLFCRKDSTADLVQVISAWHLRSSKKAKNGAWAICVSNGTLDSGRYDHDEFPLIQYRWKERALGFTGCGLVEETKGAQLRVNKLIRSIEAQQDLGSNSWIFIESGSDVMPEQISNAPLQLVRYTGAQPPIFYKHDATPGDLRSELAYIRQETFEQVGLSPAQLQGQVPENLKSGAALRMHENIGSRRHVVNAQQYERFFVECARLLERLNDDAAAQAKEEGHSYTVRTVESRGRTEVLTSLKWEEATLDAGLVKCWPVSSLPTTPSGKLQTIQDFLEAGFISPVWAMKLLDFPDLDATMALELANLNLVLWHMERIVHDQDDEVAPTPMQNIEMSLDLAKKSFVHAQLLQVDDETLDRIKRYYDACQMILDNQQAANTNGMPQGAAPQPQLAPGDLQVAQQATL